MYKINTTGLQMVEKFDTSVLANIAGYNRPRYNLVVDEDVKKSNKQTNRQTKLDIKHRKSTAD